jgi:Flp pilus assembly protein TadD
MVWPAALLVVTLAGQGAAQPAPASTDITAQAYVAFLQGWAADDKGDLAGAVAAYRRAIDLAPTAAAPHAAIAQIYARQGQIDPAAREATTALGLDADNRDAHRVLGFVRAAQADQQPARASALLAEAIGHFEKVLGNGVSDLGASLTLGQLYIEHGDYKKAITVLQGFLEERPGYPQAVMLLSDAYRRNGQPNEAAALLRDPTGASPGAAGPAAPAATTIEAKIARAESLEDANNWAAAAAAWRDITSGPGGDAFRPRYATALVNSGDLAAGRAVLLAVTNQNPKDVSAWFLLAQVEERRGDLAAAETAARKMQIRPTPAGRWLCRKFSVPAATTRA